MGGFRRDGFAMRSLVAVNANGIQFHPDHPGCMCLKLIAFEEIDEFRLWRKTETELSVESDQHLLGEDPHLGDSGRGIRVHVLLRHAAELCELGPLRSQMFKVQRSHTRVLYPHSAGSVPIFINAVFPHPVGQRLIAWKADQFGGLGLISVSSLDRPSKIVFRDFSD